MLQPIALHGHTRAVTKVRYNRDGDLLFSTAKDHFPTVWSSATGERLGTYDGHQGAIWDVDVNFASTLVATAGADQCAKIWNCKTGECVATLEHDTPVKHCAFSHGDSMLMTVGMGSFGLKPAIHIFNLPAQTPEGLKAAKTEYRPMFTYTVPEKITCATWGPTNDTIYFGSEDGSVVILDVQAQKEVEFSQPHRSEVKNLVFDKDYYCLLSCSTDQTGKLLDAKTLRCMKTYETDKPVNDCAIAPNMKLIALGGGQDAQSITNISHKQNKFETRFFHTVFAEELSSVSGHFGPINSLDWSPDGKTFATGGEDGFVRLHVFDEEYHRQIEKI